SALSGRTAAIAAIRYASRPSCSNRRRTSVTTFLKGPSATSVARSKLSFSYRSMSNSSALNARTMTSRTSPNSMPFIISRPPDPDYDRSPNRLTGPTGDAHPLLRPEPVVVLQPTHVHQAEELLLDVRDRLHVLLPRRRYCQLLVRPPHVGCVLFQAEAVRPRPAVAGPDDNLPEPAGDRDPHLAVQVAALELAVVLGQHRAGEEDHFFRFGLLLDHLLQVPPVVVRGRAIEPGHLRGAVGGVVRVPVRLLNVL